MGGGCRTFFYNGHPYTFGPHHLLVDVKQPHVYDYMAQYLDLRKMDHYNMSYVAQDEAFYTYPIHKDEVELMPDKDLIYEELDALPDSGVAKNVDEFWRYSIGDTLYNKFMNSYSKKMWGIKNNTQLDEFTFSFKNKRENALKTGPKKSFDGTKVLKEIGCDIIELDCNLDYNFPKYNPNPEDLKMLHAISKAVKDNNADIGFGFDGDGDRVGVIDDKGNEIFSDKIGLLIARNLSVKHSGSKFVVDVKSTGLHTKDKILLQNNCKTIYWKTGHSHIKRKVNSENALAGFEKSGHFFFNQPLGYGYDDGINSAIQVCHIINNQNKNMSEIINDLPNTYKTPTMAPFCKDEEKYQVVEDLLEKVKELKNNKKKYSFYFFTFQYKIIN